MQPLPVPLDVAALGQLAQHVLERRAIGVLGAKGARDLAGADIAGTLADELEKLLARGEGGSFHMPLIGRMRPKNTVMARCVGLFGSLRGLAWCFSGRRPLGRARARPFG